MKIIREVGNRTKGDNFRKGSNEFHRAHTLIKEEENETSLF